MMKWQTFGFLANCAMFLVLNVVKVSSSGISTKTKLTKNSHSSFACANASDCSLLGQCNVTTSTCSCYKGWHGNNCGLLNLSYKFADNLYQSNGYHNSQGLSSWDGSVIFDKNDGKWHLFVSILTNNCEPDQFLTNSYVAHLVSHNSSAIGPYSFSDVALNIFNDTYNISKHWDGLSVFNPFITQNVSDGTYYLFYTGTTQSNGSHLNCSNADEMGAMGAQGTYQKHNSLQMTEATYNQRIGAAYSSSLYGPWKRFDNNPIIDVVNGSKEWDSLFVTNSNPYVLSNGSLIVVYKGRSAADSSLMYTGYAIVDGQRWNDTYFRYNYSFNVATNCEDGFFWEVNNSGDTGYATGVSSYHMLYHCKCNGLHGYSNDLIHWNYNQQQPWCNITLNNGTQVTLQRRERPDIVFEDDTSAINAKYIFNSVQGPSGPTFNLVESL